MDDKEIINIIPSKDISFKTRSLLSQILSRLELTNQDRLDLEKYITFGGGENLDYVKDNLKNIEYIKDNFEDFIKWKDKILNIVKDAPEEFDTLIEIFNHIEQHIQDAPFETGDVEHSAVLKGGNNEVISEGGVALGKDNLVGLKGFYYKYITLKAGGNTKLANVYLSKTQVSNPTIDTNSGASFKDTSIKPQNYWAVGDIISIVNDAKYDDIATVKQIKDGLVQIEWLDGKSPFSTVKPESDLSSEDYSVYCLDKPTQGISDLGKYSFATGTDNKAINVYTEVSGKGNVAKGKFAKVWGKDNVGGYNTTTFGTNNINLADNSFVNGTNNINEGNNSVIHGNKNKNYGKRAFIVGNENITNNENEVAFGKYNNSENDTQFSIGIGTSDTDRKNAFEVKQNGDIYIEGVEGRIQDKLNGGSSATPDWNAAEGEEGFIKNKPFNLVTEDVDFELYDGRAAAYISDIEDYDGFYILDKLMQFNGNYNFTIDYYEGFEAYHGITIELQYNDVYIIPNYTDEFDSIESFVDHCNEIIKVFKIKVIDTFFIPDTVIKTTPQELLDTDKNQALANLGIDPVVWKYICNPLIIEDGMDVPDELYVEGSDCLKYDYTAMYKFYESSEYRFCVQADYDRLIDSKDQNWYINMKTFYLE